MSQIEAVTKNGRVDLSKGKQGIGFLEFDKARGWVYQPLGLTNEDLKTLYNITRVLNAKKP